ncbi:xanthine dehydrogenase family protein molybdopterin-binding subunit [Variovorax sp. J22G73]|uniref:xanthine dehydrogenase family protein molybdopterin-binding subunit n=1 Tax=unclassified Variovorax TaxID=663243 RepID=UPI002577AE83|nr:MULTISPECIES: xanthine dehydrogenase family protein molybdopterin-binding subunit [unclassified Variovorax]MDM0010586.1 xanthine dehydrogenase family protein molybdopterin-binding subunit [Variovorax sp. J22R203]MDM0103085.1 xanthine dehydrogenase family protein molybdopterin-binding subunit [Variovorax sp. J22G73]
MTDLIESLHAPTADEGTGSVTLGMPVSRVDGRAKVTGEARYAAEHPAEGLDRELAYGVIVNSTIAKGRILSMHIEAALAVPGVMDILTHENHPKTRSLGVFYKDMTSPGGSPFKPLHDANIRYSGQPIALVVAQTFEAARYAASLVIVDYDIEPHETDLMAHLDRAHKPSRLKAGYSPPPGEKGDAEMAFARAPVSIDAEYYSGVEHHNPMEMFASTVLRDDEGHYLIYDKTQSSQNSRWYVSRIFGLSKHKVTVRNPYVGGAFGSGLRPQYQLILAMMAAIHLERSVRVVMTRQQMFTFGHRPETFQRVKLAAERDGTLRAIVHTALAETSRFEDYVEVVVNWSGQLYTCDNIKLGYEIVSLDQFSPIDMRAPGAAHGVHALEVAMDELAHALQMDPLALRLKNYAERNPMDDMPYSTKELAACYHQGAERFGWASRSLEPRSMRDGHELVGWGMATGTWDAMQMFARASAVLYADGRLLVSSAATDIGTGTYTVMGMIAAAAMGLPLEQVTFQLGDSTLPVAPIEGGSSHVTTVGSAVQGACEKLQRRLFRMARALPHSPVAEAPFEQIEFVEGRLRLKQSPEKGIALSVLMSANGIDRVEEKYLLLPSLFKQRKYVRATHSAVFCEVKVDEALGTVRVTRVVSAIAAGRILSAKTAHSQVTGAVVWGISQALHEETHSDHRLGRFMNHNLAEYHVAVNADIHDIDVIFVHEDDRVVSELGAKGVGEIGIVGVAAAVSNAIFHATGRRIRSTPMTPDKVMAP